MKLQFALAALALSACKAAAPPPPEPPMVVIIGDASIPEGGVCQRACAVMRALSCPEGGPVGVYACETSCEVLRFEFDYECVARSRSTDDVHACHVRCEP